MSSPAATTVKRRGRKPKNGAVQQPDTSTSANDAAIACYGDTAAMLAPQDDDDNVIMKLDIDRAAFQPGAYNASQQSAFESRPCTIDALSYSDDTPIEINDNDNHLTTRHNMRLLMEFEQKSKSNAWPTDTTVSCYWCCNRFDNPPIGIPTKYKEDRFHVFGCFCSLSCAAAYNFDSKESITEVWERFTLINMMSFKMGGQKVVQPAPSRLTLHMFGGPLSIEDFRKMGSSNETMIVYFPPMVMMTQQVEEVNNKDIKSEYRYIPIDNERINRYQEKIRLRRSKPLYNFKNTLDHSMRLKYDSAVQ